MQPKRFISALAGILALSLAAQPPLEAAGRAISATSGGNTGLAAGPAGFSGNENSSINLSISAPNLTGGTLPALEIPALAEPAAQTNAETIKTAGTPAAPKKRAAFKKKVAALASSMAALAESGAEIQESGSTGDSHEHGQNIETLLTGVLPIAADLDIPMPSLAAAKGLPPLNSGPPPGLQPSQPHSKKIAPAVRVAEPIIQNDRSGNTYRPDHPFSGFFKLLSLQNAERPGLLGSTLAAALLGVIPGIGAIALHEYGHYLIARLTGSGAASMQMFIPESQRTVDENGYSTLGFVNIGPPKTPFRNYVLSAAGPAFGALSFIGMTLGIPIATVAAIHFGWIPGEILPGFALGGAALWATWYWNAGKRWAFHGGKSDREHMDAARAEMFQYSNQAVRIGPLLGPPLAHLQVTTGLSAQETLKRALKLLDEYHQASDRYGWVNVDAGGERFRFPLQSTNKAHKKASVGYRPLPEPSIPTGEHWYQGEPEIVTVPLDPAERKRLRRHKSRLKYPWNSWVFYDALHLYSTVLETEKRHGPVTLIPAR
ncbi:MAG: hypothetical protein COB53_01415 [Elusimicrobia bacterium]|nr:MAG: hypothetical protein COB53_01415 [Elusimicrobiota bacterium]